MRTSPRLLVPFVLAFALACGDGSSTDPDDAGANEVVDSGADASGDAGPPSDADLDADLDAAPDAAVDVGIDSDSDDVPDDEDNCPDVANTSQDDFDGDHHGDACDVCPTLSNPGDAGCPASIYQVKDGTYAPGARVALTNVLVTANDADGFYVQLKNGDGGYVAPARSGVYVASAGNAVARGNRVNVTGVVVVDAGTTRIDATLVVLASALVEAGPAPVIATADEIATGGTRASDLEGVVVRVTDVAVTDAAPTAGAGDVAPTHEFVVDGTVRVDDLYYALPTPVAAGDVFARIDGVLAFRHGNTKIEPRDASDLVLGAPSLVAFGPATSFARVNQSGTPTFPDGLTVTVSRPVPTDTFVAVASGDPASLTIVGGGVTIQAGQDHAFVLVNGLAQAASVTLTASLGSVSSSAQVRVLDPSEVPSTVTLTPNAPTVPSSGTVLLTVHLDIPAPAGGTNIDLGVMPSSAGTIPATISVSANQRSAAFLYEDSGSGTAGAVTATLGASTSTVVVTVGP